MNNKEYTFGEASLLFMFGIVQQIQPDSGLN
jgi:hypothetical protein